MLSRRVMAVPLAAWLAAASSTFSPVHALPKSDRSYAGACEEIQKDYNWVRWRYRLSRVQQVVGMGSVIVQLFSKNHGSAHAPLGAINTIWGTSSNLAAQRDIEALQWRAYHAGCDLK